MKKNLLILLLFLISACYSEKMKVELQRDDPIVGSWNVIRLDTNEERDRVIYRPEGTWSSLLSVVSDREEIGYWSNISEGEDFNNINQSYIITFKEQKNEINGVYNDDFNSFVYEIDGEVVKYVKILE
tara:strand:+ start:399 stop:782 length:384 start_codon:yes stop_codon:yes gene_type:complete